MSRISTSFGGAARRTSRLKSVSPKVKVSCIFRKMNGNKKWLTEVIEEYIKFKKETEINKESTNNLEEDLLDPMDKMVMLLHKSYRTDSQITTIAEKLNFILPFVRYSMPITKDLVRNAYIQGYEAGRILYLPNQDSLSAYFILSGVIEVVPEETSDPVMEFQKLILKDWEFKEMRAAHNDYYTRGHMLGRKELLFGEPRKRIAIIKKDVLCIKFDKQFMLQTLEPLLRLWFEVFSYLKTFDLFYYLDMDIMRELCKLGRIESYGVNKLVNASDTSCFLIEGEAYVIQRLLIQKYLDTGKWSLKLYEDQDTIEYGDDVDSVFMQVMVLNKGAYFGLGERMSKHIIWTKQPCKFIQFTRTELFEYGDPSVWEGQRIYLDGLYPTTEQLFKYFLYGRQWLKYKQELTNQIISNRQRNVIHNVPMPLRCNHMKMSKSSLKRLGITSMDDYLKGGLDPLGVEIKHSYVLDKSGGLREKLFGRFKTVPNYKSEVQETLEDDKKQLYDTCPSFFFYNVLKQEGFINEEN
ncbi:uncharacterized protein [Halyomorpha halys]|uniref:uncharacterized protein n=1 Tax=Halyomorpha halys TaxID=286706 RepID=UPI0006D4FD64|nr:uncharacterized protein LOC106688008 [Halyomorpha halys]